MMELHVPYRAYIRLAEIEQEPRCVKILCSHDADVKPQIIEF